MLGEIVDMVKLLTEESSARNWKINEMIECVVSIKDDYFKLKQRVELIKAHGNKNQWEDSDNTCNPGRPETSNIKQCLVELNDTLEEIEGFVHPCGGPGWRKLEDLNMNDPNQQCPGAWSESDFFGKRACTAADSTVLATYTVTESYSQVCGQVQGYGSGSAFDGVLGTDHTLTLTEYRSISGVVVGVGTEHVWTFLAGATPDELGVDDADCPCLVGEDEFVSDVGVSLPTLPGTDYFCESPPSSNFLSGATTTVTDTILWDGLNCDPDSLCCIYGTPPVFYKVLSAPTSDPLEISTTVPVFQMTLYVR